MTEIEEAAYTNRYWVSARWGNPDAHPFALETADELVALATGTKQSAAPSPVPPENYDSVVDRGPEAKVALVVGHNARQKGAYVKGSLNQFEYDFHNIVADYILEKTWPGLTAKRFNRVYAGSYYSEIREVYGRVNAWKPDLAIEMHFNGYNGKTGYSFMLHHHASDTSRKCAEAMNDVFVDATGFDDKGTKALYSGDRGYTSTAKCASPHVLTEPFFGDYPPHASKISAFGHERFADIYLEAIAAAILQLA